MHNIYIRFLEIMLYRFTIQNYCSFKEKNEFSLIASNEEHKSHLSTLGGFSVLRTAAIYGPNAAGKTKFIRALDVLRGLVIGEFQINELPNQAFLLDSKTKNDPTMFIVELIRKGELFQYGVVLSFSKGIILEEICRKWNPEVNKFETIFSRENVGDKVDILTGDGYVLPEQRQKIDFIIDEIKHSNTELALSKLSQTKSLDCLLKDEVLQVYEWFENLLILSPNSRINLFRIVGKEDTNALYTKYLKKFELDIKGIELVEFNRDSVEIPEKTLLEIRKQLRETGRKHSAHFSSLKQDYLIKLDDNNELKIYGIRFRHEKNSNKASFKQNDESDGTMRIFDFIPLFSIISEKEAVVVIDEIDRSLHSQMTRHLIELFINMAGAHNCQLIFTTHDVMLMSRGLLYPTEIWFVDKIEEVSSIYPLSKFDLSKLPKEMEYNYLLGRFNAIPFKHYGIIK